MTCILIDDEADCLELLALLIQKYCPGLSVIGQYDHPRQAIDAIWEHRPELVFLDVDMPEINGFGVLDACRDLPFQVIFTTAYQEYAVKAFRYSATDYLLKPVDRNDLWEAIQKAMQERSAQQLAEQREILFNYLHPTQPGKEKIALPTAEGLFFVPVADIVYCQADGNYTNIFLEGRQKEMLFVKPLKEIEEMLHGGDFFRTHNSYLANLKKVRQYIKGEGGELKMSNDRLVPVARPKKQELLQRLGNI
ncbi:MAG: response regulator transcription factor [Lewinellaceae bacterium]|nr:response regulator transcription factor [Saprospiraceae bacterium]MCB9334387.1 response regulator transcription factor [Lewinellaceae bacterium]